MKRESGRGNLLDNKKFNMSVIIFNIIMIIGLLVTFIIMFTSRNTKEPDVKLISDTDVQTLVEEADALMPSTYTMLLQNSDFNLGDGVEFHFGSDGNYSGYFDADNKAVEEYQYSVSADEDGSYKLTISDKKNTKYVEYIMSLDTDGNIILKYPGMDQELALSFTEE